MKLGIVTVCAVVLAGCFDLDAVTECVRQCANVAGDCAYEAVVCESRCGGDPPAKEACELGCKLDGIACAEEGAVCVSYCGDEL